MKRTCIILFSLLVAGMSGFAQVEADQVEEIILEEAEYGPEYYMGGDFELGGYISMLYRNKDVYTDNPNFYGKSMMIVDDLIYPAYFPLDKLSVGAMVQLYIWKRGEHTGVTAAIGPRVEYYAPKPIGPGFPYAHLGMLFKVIETLNRAGNDQFINDDRIEFGPGYAVPLSENITVASLLYYSIDTWDPPGSGNKTKGSRFGMRVGFKFFHF